MIFGVTETWLSSTVVDGEILPTSYSLYRCDRVSRGGGVLLAVHQSIHSSIIHSPPHLEVVCIQIVSSMPLVLCLVYIPPSASIGYVGEILSFLDSIISSFSNVVILGDFNAPDICWATLLGQCSSSESLCDFVFRHDLTQVVNFPTHTGGNILDLILCTPSTYDFISDPFAASSNLLISDHSPISFLLSLSLKRPASLSSSWFYNYKKTDFDKLNSFLLDFDFTPILDSNDVDYIWAFLKKIILTSISLFTPIVKTKKVCLPKWFHSGIRHQLHLVHSLRKRYKKHCSPDNLTRLSSAECQLQLSILDARISYEGGLLQDFICSKSPS